MTGSIGKIACVALLLTFWAASAQDGRQEKDERWYGYDLGGTPMGYAFVSFESDASQGIVRKSKFRFRRVGERSSQEECSAVLSPDQRLKSAVLSAEQDGRKKSWVVTVADRVVIQSEGRVFTFPDSSIYLEVEDLLRSTASKKLSVGRVYSSKILATDWSSLTDAGIRYLGREEFAVDFRIHRAHKFSVRTGELGNFRATAWIDQEGRLLGYRLGEFGVFAVPARFALQVRQNLKPLDAPVIFEEESISSMKWKFPEAHGDIYHDGPYQKVEGREIASRGFSRPAGASAKESAPAAKYLANSKLVPSSHPLISKYAAAASRGASDPAGIARNVAAWVRQHVIAERTAIGQELYVAFGMGRDTPAILTAALCRAHRVPSRVVAGLVYAPGKVSCESWAEAYLGMWIPLHDGSLTRGARFIEIHPDSVWADQKNPPAFSLSLTQFERNRRVFRLDAPATFFSETKGEVRDLLLGISCRVPAGWSAGGKEVGADNLLFQSERGGLMFLKVFRAPKSLQEMLESLKVKVSRQKDLEVLWQNPRSFPGGEALEAAIESKTSGFVYRVFVAERQRRGISLLWIVSAEDLSGEENSFQSLVASLRFLSPEEF